MTFKQFVIVGTGLAGHRAAIALGKLKRGYRVQLIGEEEGLPYDRPPLTKDFLLGRQSRDDLILKGTDSYADLGICHRPSIRISKVLREQRTVVTDQGESIPYDRLLLATGSRPRRLADVAADIDVHYIRTLEDSLRLRASLCPGRSIAVVGGGFIGLEVASAATLLGCRVTVIEAAPRLLARTMPPFVSSYVQGLHQRRGVEIILDAVVQAIVREGDGRISVQLPRRTIEADCVVAGIGVVPNTELAEQAGLKVNDGIVVGRSCVTSDPHIFAAGEVTAHPTTGSGALRRVESWRVASEQPLVAALSMSGSEATFDEPPWLWSDQFDVNLQAVGAPYEGAQHLLSDDPKKHRWTLVCLDESGNIVGAVAANSGAHISMLRRVMRTGGVVPESLLANTIPLREEPDWLPRENSTDVTGQVVVGPDGEANSSRSTKPR